MASLDNFPSNNGPHSQYPTRQQRMDFIRMNLMSSQASAWDLANAAPVAPVQPVDVALRAGAGGNRPDPQITERVSHRSMKGYLVPTEPQVYGIRGDNAEALYHVDTGAQSRSWLSNWWKGNGWARIRTYSRFHPYQR